MCDFMNPIDMITSFN